MNKWTNNDEHELQALLARKEATLRENRQPLEMTAAAYTGAGKTSTLVDWLIANAEQVRDLLEPFDSGVRPKADAT